MLMAKAVYVGVESEKIDFPELQPEMDYTLIGKYTTSQIWTAPEDGTYKIEVHGASGNGGRGTIYDFEDSDGDVWYNWGAGDGGGGSGYGCSIGKVHRWKPFPTHSSYCDNRSAPYASAPPPSPPYCPSQSRWPAIQHSTMPTLRATSSSHEDGLLPPIG